MTRPDYSKVTRFEVIGPEGRILTAYSVAVDVQLQDDGRTLKVFIDNTASTLDAHDRWVAAGRPGAIPHEDILRRWQRLWEFTFIPRPAISIRPYRFIGVRRKDPT